MTTGEPVPGSGDRGFDSDPSGFGGSDTPTPPEGLPLGGLQAQAAGPLGYESGEAQEDTETPAQGIEGISEVVTAEDFGKAGPAVFGAEDPGGSRPDGAGDWPSLEYRSRSKPERSGGSFDWLRRRRSTE